MYTRRPSFICYEILIIVLGILILPLLITITETYSWAMAQSQVQSLNQKTIKQGQQSSSPQPTSVPSTPDILQSSGPTQTVASTPADTSSQPIQQTSEEQKKQKAAVGVPSVSGSEQKAVNPQTPEKKASKVQSPASPVSAQMPPPTVQQKTVGKPDDTTTNPSTVKPAAANKIPTQSQPQKAGDETKSKESHSPQVLMPPYDQRQKGIPLLPDGRGMPGMLPPPPVVPHTGTMARPRKGQIVLNFDDADVYTVIQTIFGEVLRVNYIVDPRVKGRVTFRSVAPVPVDEVLPLMEVILRLNGIAVVEHKGLYRIIPISDIPKEPSPVSYGRDPEKIPITGKAFVQVVPIIYVQSSEVLKLITPFASTNAVLIDVPKSNQIIVVDTDANIRRILKLVEIFDNEKQKQRKPYVFVYLIRNGKAKDIANLLQQIFLGSKGLTTERTSPVPKTLSGTASHQTPTQPGTIASPSTHNSSISGGVEAIVSEFTRFIPDEITNSITILSTPEDYAVIKKTIEDLDIVPRQVIIEGMIASVSLTDNLSLGISGLFKGSISLGGNKYSTRGALNPSGLAVDPNNLSLDGFTFVGIDVAGAVRAVITTLATDSKAKVLAAPHILVSDNRDAKIQVGQQVPLITTETYGSTTVAPQRTYQYRDIGIILKVKPRINSGGLVAIELYQEISTYEKIALSGEDQLLLDKTDVTTELVVQDGQTIVIGGLIREDTSKSRSGIPFLSKIPIIGWLFGNTEDDKSRQEIIILLTPHVIKDQHEAKDATKKYIDKMTESSEGRIKKEDLIKEVPLSKERIKPKDK
ncbi:MAG: secretin N-terminal domain-containing protein [Syntrophaceae bacterium]